MCKIPKVFEASTVNITWDTVHIMLTLAIYVTLIIFIWATGIIPCRDRTLKEKKTLKFQGV